MIATATALLECRPVRGRSLVVALGVVVDVGIMSLMLVSSGQGTQVAAASEVQVSWAVPVSDVRTAVKGDRLVSPVRFDAARASGGDEAPARLRRTA